MFIQELIFSKWLIFVTFGAIWIPQIYTNTMKGYKNSPSIFYSIASSLQLLLIPIYVRGIEGNFTGLQPDYLFSFFLVSYVSILLMILGVQQKFPRILLPQSSIERMMEDYYRYETTFEAEAALSS
jgi:hypothetical protein